MKMEADSKNRHAGICYGILFFLLVKCSYELVYKLTESLFLFLGLNLMVVPVLLVLLILSFTFWYARMQEFPKLRVLYFVICLCFILIEPFVFIKSSEIARTISDKRYSQYQSFISLCNTLSLLLFLTISFYKFVKISKQENIHKSFPENN